MLGQITFVKLRDLASPADIATLSLDQVVELLTAYYRPKTRTLQVFQVCSRRSGTSNRFRRCPKATSKDIQF